METDFRLLVIADVHYAPSESDAGEPVREEYLRGRELFVSALRGARRAGFDAVAQMGDMVNDGASPRAASALGELRSEMDALAGDVPRLVVPGNHDPAGARTLERLGARAGLHEIGGFRFIVFTDAFDGLLASRGEAGRRLLADAAGRAGGPIVACQHNPLHPPTEAACPYMLSDRGDVMRQYSQCGVLLSISGHYHPGQPLHRAGGVWYVTAPALCTPPFCYLTIVLRANRVAVEPASVGGA